MKTFNVQRSKFKVEGSRFKSPVSSLQSPISQFATRNSQFQAGFTILELIIVITIVGILAASIGYRFSSTADTSTPVAVDQVTADIQYVQMRAMGTGLQQNISFNVGSNTYSIPGEQKTLPGDAVITATTLPGNTLTFNSLGEPTFSGTGDRTITVSGSGTVTIYALTGRVSG